MRLIIGFIIEYLLILKIHVVSLGKTPPAKWSVGNKGDIILVLGFGETWRFLENIGNHLNQLGFRIHTIPEFSYNTLPISSSVQKLEDFVEYKNLTKVILLSHSKGGLIAKRYIDKGSNAMKVIRLFSIASPYQGTIWGYLYFFSLFEIAPDSLDIHKILSHTTNNKKIINIYAKWDNHIIPYKNAVLPGAVNKQIDVVGHTRVITAKETLTFINTFF